MANPNDMFVPEYQDECKEIILRAMAYRQAQGLAMEADFHELPPAEQVTICEAALALARKGYAELRIIRHLMDGQPGLTRSRAICALYYANQALGLPAPVSSP